jgi:hypothetical protein
MFSAMMLTLIVIGRPIVLRLRKYMATAALLKGGNAAGIVSDFGLPPFDFQACLRFDT